jgi:hypothetical protein
MMQPPIEEFERMAISDSNNAGNAQPSGDEEGVENQGAASGGNSSAQEAFKQPGHQDVPQDQEKAELLFSENQNFDVWNPQQGGQEPIEPGSGYPEFPDDDECDDLPLEPSSPKGSSSKFENSLFERMVHGAEGSGSADQSENVPDTNPEREFASTLFQSVKPEQGGDSFNKEASGWVGNDNQEPGFHFPEESNRGPDGMASEAFRAQGKYSDEGCQDRQGFVYQKQDEDEDPEALLRKSPPANLHGEHQSSQAYSQPFSTPKSDLPQSRGSAGSGSNNYARPSTTSYSSREAMPGLMDLDEDERRRGELLEEPPVRLLSRRQMLQQIEYYKAKCLELKQLDPDMFIPDDTQEMQEASEGNLEALESVLLRWQQALDLKQRKERMESWVDDKIDEYVNYATYGEMFDAQVGPFFKLKGTSDKLKTLLQERRDDFRRWYIRSLNVGESDPAKSIQRAIINFYVMHLMQKGVLTFLGKGLRRVISKNSSNFSADTSSDGASLGASGDPLGGNVPSPASSSSPPFGQPNFNSPYPSNPNAGQPAFAQSPYASAYQANSPSATNLPPGSAQPGTYPPFAHSPHPAQFGQGYPLAPQWPNAWPSSAAAQNIQVPYAQGMPHYGWGPPAGMSQGNGSTDSSSMGAGSAGQQPSQPQPGQTDLKPDPAAGNTPKPKVKRVFNPL